MSLKSINNLLNSALKRANIGRQVSASIIVATCNDVMAQLLPEDGKRDARVMSFARGTVVVQATNGFVCEHLKQCEHEFLKHVEDKLETSVVLRVRYRVGIPNEYDF